MISEGIYYGYKRLLYKILERDMPKEEMPRRVIVKVWDKRCRKCGAILDTGYRKRKRGLMCRACYMAFNRTRARQYYMMYPERVRATIKKSEAKLGKQPVRGRSKYLYPDTEYCSAEGCKRVGQRHHPDYNDANNIVWLCSYHHKRLHRLDGGVLESMI